ncbi:hypothetical protein [Janthinobacterium sp.]|uniref:hypothetical protein n=1 Tax=Janthinobacterium sp. TaxID=1871054 RepID=UPI00293D43F3|nr:hypothetical protein [Janthinobacterium sp.]
MTLFPFKQGALLALAVCAPLAPAAPPSPPNPLAAPSSRPNPQRNELLLVLPMSLPATGSETVGENVAPVILAPGSLKNAPLSTEPTPRPASAKRAAPSRRNLPLQTETAPPARQP